MSRALNFNHVLYPFALAAGLAGANAEATPTFQWATGAGGNGHSYMATDTPSTWTEANALAASLGGYLVSINSAAEQAFLESTFATGAAGNPNFAFWTGLNDAQTEGTFVWTSGEPVSFFNWSNGEPNNYTGGISTPEGEDYAVLNWLFANGFSGALKGQWNDAGNNGCNLGCLASQPYRAIIEFNTPPTPVTPADTLSVNLSASPEPVLVGDRLTYSALIANTGNSPLTGVRLAVNLPDSVALVEASAACSLNTSLVNIVECNVPRLEAGASATPTITVRSGLPGQISAGVSVSANETDPNTSNNLSTAVTTVAPSSSLPVADLAISFGGPRNVKFKSKPTFSLTIRNRSNIPVPQVVVSGQFPDNVKLNVKLPKFCTRNDQNLVRCGIGFLPAKFSKTFRLKAKATRRAVVATTATISSFAISDSDPGNNVAPITVKVR